MDCSKIQRQNFEIFRTTQLSLLLFSDSCSDTDLFLRCSYVQYHCLLYTQCNLTLFK